jgi:predicted ribosome quality control (RQC) complex YloA/Tae2 family protein
MADAKAVAISVSDRLLDVSRGVTKAQRRVARRAFAIEGDIRAIDGAQTWAARAPWLVAAATRAPRGAKELTVSDWSSGVEEVLKFPLDPGRSAREQVDEVFAQARRLRRGREVALDRLNKATAEGRRLAALAADVALALDRVALDGGVDPEKATELEARLRRLSPTALPSRARGKAPARLPYNEFIVSGGLRALVGRSAADNDELTLHVAKPYHVFLHAKGITGSHVIACIAKDHSLTPDQLVDCAHLAAHFSDARGEAMLEISYLPRRFVRKPRKSPPGLVVLDREKVLVLRVDPERMKRLLTGQPAAGEP